jgi:SsrA-binding protein
MRTSRPATWVLRVVKVWWMPPKGDADLGLHAVRLQGQHRGVVAPGQELGVLRHVGDQREHLFGAVPDEDGFVDGFHGECGPGGHCRERPGPICQPMSTKKKTPTRIADNKKAAYNYFFEERFEAGMVLEGWEVKALREGKVQLTDGYVVIRNGELFLIGCQITPLKTASTHVNPDSIRTKKLLMKKDEIKRLVGKVEQKGHTLVPCSSTGRPARSSAEIALAKGKAEHDKRDTIKDREGKREVERAMKSATAE